MVARRVAFETLSRFIYAKIGAIKRGKDNLSGDNVRYYEQLCGG